MSAPTMFRVPLSQVEGRLDPFFYQPELLTFSARIRARADCKKLSTLGRFQRGVVYSTEDETQDGVPVLRANNINLSTGQLDLIDLVKIGRHLVFDKAQRIQVGDILICAASGSKEHAGKACLIHAPIEAYIGGFMMALRCHPSVNTEYVGYYLQSNLFRKQIHRHLGGTNINNISIGLLSSLDVLLPNSKTQEQIATLMRQAYAQKTKLEEQAQALLNSVDALFYEHLGLKPLRRGDRAIHQRIFRIPLKLVAGQVFDPKSYHPDSLALLQLLTESQFPKCRLLDLVTHRSAGDWGEDEDQASEDYTRCLVIRGTEFDNQFNLRIDNSRAKHRQILTSKLQRMRIEAGDLLIEKSGGSADQPVGRVACIEQSLLDSQPIAYSNFVEKIKIDSSRISPEYLHFYLRFIHSIGVTDLLQSQTNGIRNLMLKRYLTLPISLPTKTEQARLVNDVQTIQNQAQALHQQAQDLLAQAQQQTEALILGAPHEH